jgi:hypothetical protein
VDDWKKKRRSTAYGVSSIVDVIIGRQTLLWCDHRNNLTAEKIIKNKNKKESRKEEGKVTIVVSLLLLLSPVLLQ